MRGTPAECPRCAALVDPAAGRCVQCGSALAPEPEPAAAPPASAPAPAAARGEYRWLVGALLATVVLIVLVVRLTGGAADAEFQPAPVPTSDAAAPVTPSPPAGAAEQAAAVDALLDSSTASRTRLATALADVGACRRLPAAAAALRDVTAQRDRQVRELAGTATDRLPDGTAVRTTLAAALRESAAADRAFTRWAERAAAGRCADGDADRRDGMAASARARSAKLAFCAVWNRVAAEHGLAERDPDRV
ncbi:hypothetical protein GCM10010123_07590 [Pilimelia anulata]|uniref:Zinc ribbon domain-containing protein n=1 Tax=Pilimelia anulata TaxID=53371 RepID=A0A8J3B0B2_9ACTN|nr:hypothetical protein [Pilimelia anulata]GGJ80196.1 hypothetical protein GCM10010123_07590 [Pilimelia anulata]